MRTRKIDLQVGGARAKGGVHVRGARALREGGQGQQGWTATAKDPTQAV